MNDTNKAPAIDLDEAAKAMAESPFDFEDLASRIGRATHRLRRAAVTATNTERTAAAVPWQRGYRHEAAKAAAEQDAAKAELDDLMGESWVEYWLAIGQRRVGMIDRLKARAYSWSAWAKGVLR